MRFLLQLLLALCCLTAAPAANNAITVRLTRTGTPSAWQAFVANPLDLTLTFATAGQTFTGATSLRIELHPDRLVDTDRAPLALITQASPTGATTTATFTGAQLNQDLLGKTSRAFWLVAYATYPDDVMQVFQLGTLTLLAHPASLTAPAPPNPAVALTQTAADLLYAALDTVEAQALLIADLTARIEVLEAGGTPSALTVDSTTITADDTSITADQTTL